MVIYEITATVRGNLIKDYEKYMREQHIFDLLTTGYFNDAEISQSGAGRYRIRYIAHDQNALDNYLAHEAERLRSDFALHFPEGIEISREVWSVIQTFSA